MVDGPSLGVYTMGALLLIVSPGPDFVYVMTRGIAQGRQGGVVSALGIGLGLLTHTLLAALGLTALLVASPLTFEIVRYVGALYLMYLGIRILRSGHILPDTTLTPAENMDSRHILLQGMLTNLFNPKALLTFLAFIPQFVVKGEPGEVVLLGGILAALGIFWFSFVGYFAGIVGQWLTRSRLARLIPWIVAAIFVILGLRVALSRI